jgi:hypothetical protein
MLRGLRETAAAAERERIEAGLRRCAFEVGESSASANRGLTP